MIRVRARARARAIVRVILPFLALDNALNCFNANATGRLGSTIV